MGIESITIKGKRQEITVGIDVERQWSVSGNNLIEKIVIKALADAKVGDIDEQEVINANSPIFIHNIREINKTIQERNQTIQALNDSITKLQNQINTLGNDNVADQELINQYNTILNA